MENPKIRLQISRDNLHQQASSNVFRNSLTCTRVTQSDKLFGKIRLTKILIDSSRDTKNEFSALACR